MVDQTPRNHNKKGEMLYFITKAVYQAVALLWL